MKSLFALCLSCMLKTEGLRNYRQELACRYMIAQFAQFVKSRLHDATKTCDHAMCVKITLCKRACMIATCDCRKNVFFISTFLRQHATVACRTNKLVYTARFCYTSHIASVLSHRTFKTEIHRTRNRNAFCNFGSE